MTLRKISRTRRGGQGHGQAGQLRIIGGRWRGRRLEIPPSPGIRPTPDRVRETLFNWLQMDIAGSRCLDLYAGSGALGIEALSRGAREVVFVDADPVATRALEAALRGLGAEAGHVVRADVPAFLTRVHEPFDIVFLDPPYGTGDVVPVLRSLDERGWLRAGGLAYLEDSARAEAPTLPPGWTLLRSRRAGEVGYHLARREPAKG
ncbi:MAG TPA: 16S rRNA (guanine(966)-N(2))-methyltransferase RsmD [Steroidobacteraceae bacterium]|nr:16S rRNA (guanine(966)-N(2))-methyltransferase RsmD [Steroidobacteraceae bacterium]